MTEPWTPGPWKLTQNGPTTAHIHASGHNVAYLPQGRIGLGVQEQADARLIQQAPEMAALLDALHSEHEWGDGAAGPMLRVGALLSRIRGNP